MKNWRYVLVIGSLVAVFLGLTLISTVVTKPRTGAEETITNRSVYNGKPSGYRAWHEVLTQAGIHTTIWRGSFNELQDMPRSAMMVLIEPYTAAGMDVVFGEDQAHALLHWVGEGNRAVIIDDFRRTGAKVLLTELDVYLDNEKSLPRKKPDEPAFYTLLHDASPEMQEFPVHRKFKYIVHNVVTEVPTRFRTDRLPRNVTDVWAVDGKTVFFGMPYKNGYIVLGTPVDIADNSFLQNKKVDNFQLLTNIILDAADGRDIVINEYVHGYTRVGDLLSYYQQHTPLGKVATQLILVFLVMLWLSFTPWKPRVSIKEEKQNISLMAFIESMAGIHFRSRAASVALSPTLANIEHTLRKRYRLGLNEPARVRALMEGLFAGYSGQGNEQVLALEKARQVVGRRQNLPHSELLKLSQQLSLIQDTLQHGSRTKN